MRSAKDIILNTVSPLLGAVFANLMFAAPLKDARHAVQCGTLGHLNPTPWAIMTGNTLGWITYSYINKNYYIFWSNAPGFVFSVWLNMVAAKLQYSDRIAETMRVSFIELIDKTARQQNTGASELEAGLNEMKAIMIEESLYDADYHQNNVKDIAELKGLAKDVALQKIHAPAHHEKIVVAVIIVWLLLISCISFISFDLDKKKILINVAVNINISFFYGAPLSTILKVLRTKDSSWIHRETMIMNTGCATFFLAYGIGLQDMALIFPNSIGVILGGLQLFLRLTFPWKDLDSPIVTAARVSMKRLSISNVEINLAAIDCGSSNDSERNSSVDFDDDSTVYSA